MLKHTLGVLTGGWRYASGLRGFLSVTLDLEEAERQLKQQLATREDSFLQVLERGVYGNPRSPYRRLLQHYGFELDDVKTLIREHGIEGALSRLFDAGIYVTLDEFKGRAPVCRPGLEFPVSAADFDNPLLKAAYEGRTGGSRGEGTRVDVDFDYIAYDSVEMRLALDALNLVGRPLAVWRPGPPSMTGLRSMFLQVRAGNMPQKWFSPTKARWNRQGLQGRLLMAYTAIGSRLAGRRVPGPEYLPNAEAMVGWLAAKVRAGEPPVMNGSPSEWVRICLAAEAAGADISGTVFRGGGEPYTEGKAAVLQRNGASGCPAYAMHEAGNMAFGCGAPSAPDDMHVLTDKHLILQRPLHLDSGLEVGAFYHTAMLTSSPKVMLNVQSGDYGVLEQRECGCLLARVGLTTHVRNVRSYEKLTSNGVMFMGSMLHQLLEETLPARFGGGPLDYQLVEEEEDGLPIVSVIVSPRVGAVADAEVIEVFSESLGFADWSRRMVDTWREAGTLRVQRCEPYLTAAGKILPLHVMSTARRGPPPEETTLPARER